MQWVKALVDNTANDADDGEEHPDQLGGRPISYNRPAPLSPTETLESAISSAHSPRERRATRTSGAGGQSSKWE